MIMRCYVLFSDNFIYSKDHTVAYDHEQHKRLKVPVAVLKECRTYTDLRMMQIQIRMSES